MYDGLYGLVEFFNLDFGLMLYQFKTNSVSKSGILCRLLFFIGTVTGSYKICYDLCVNSESNYTVSN